MKIGKKFNTLTVKEYKFYIDNHKKYTDFNTLGLYRSIVENKKLKNEEKIEIREYANIYFKKTFDFLQIKDPNTFIEVSSIGKELTIEEERNIFEKIRKYQQKYLADKKIKHRNFGIYSKHNCGNETCNYNGLMIKQNSPLTEGNMHFDSDKNKYSAKEKSERNKKDRKYKRRFLDDEI